MSKIYIETIIMYIVWTLFMSFLPEKAKKKVGYIGLALSVLLVLVMTVFDRSVYSEQRLRLTPFITLELAKQAHEFYRTMYMNALLFMPFGMSAPYTFSGKPKRKVLLTVLSGALLSVLVEAVQYVFALGVCETDDIIMNTVGVMIGVSSCGLVELIANSKWYSQAKPLIQKVFVKAKRKILDKISQKKDNV